MNVDDFRFFLHIQGYTSRCLICNSCFSFLKGVNNMVHIFLSKRINLLLRQVVIFDNNDVLILIHSQFLQKMWQMSKYKLLLADSPWFEYMIHIKRKCFLIFWL